MRRFVRTGCVPGRLRTVQELRFLKLQKCCQPRCQPRCQPAACKRRFPWKPAWKLAWKHPAQKCCFAVTAAVTAPRQMRYFMDTAVDTWLDTAPPALIPANFRSHGTRPTVGWLPAPKENPAHRPGWWGSACAAHGQVYGAAVTLARLRRGSGTAYQVRGGAPRVCVSVTVSCVI